MKKRTFLLGAVLVSTSGLTACGGDGSSDSGGGSDSTQYAGFYVGKANVTGYDANGKVISSFSETENVSVSNSGELTSFMFNFEGASPPRNCTGTPPIYLDENKFSYSYTFSCKGIIYRSSGDGTIDSNLMTVRVDKYLSDGTRSITQFKGIKQ